MPLRDPGLYDYLPYDASRPKITWPNGARVAFWVAPNVEFYELEPAKNPTRGAWPKPHPDVVGYSYRDYGNRAGFWRMLESFDRCGMRGSVSLNVAMCEHHPEIIEACAQRGWEFYSHGTYNTRYMFNMTEAQEREVIQDSIDTIKKHTGQHTSQGHNYEAIVQDESGNRHSINAPATTKLLSGAYRKSPTSNQQETSSMDRTKMLSELTANCSCEKEKAALNELSDDTLKVLHNSKVKKTSETETVVANSAAPAALTPEQVEVMNYGRESMQRDKTLLVNRLVANMTDATQKQAMVANLMQKGIPELRGLVSLLPVNNQQSNEVVPLTPLFMGAGGGPDLTVNRSSGNDVQEVKDMDWPPTLNYAELSAERGNKSLAAAV